MTETAQSTRTTTAPTTAAPAESRSRTVRGLLSLARAETTLLVRNRTALFNSILLPLLLVGMIYTIGVLDEAPAGMGSSLVATMLTTGLLFVTYYNLVTTYVARRQELVLKRMRTGELSDGAILAGTAVPTVLVTLVQTVIVAIAAAILVGLDPPTNVVLPVLAFVLGTVAFVLLAAASTAFTRTAETAQVTTLPILLMGTALSGMFYPLDIFPDTLATIASFTPAAPIIELANLGLAGVTGDGTTTDFAGSWAEAALPVGVLLAWIVVGGLLTRSTFKWEPRS